MFLPCKALSGPRVGRHINACLLLLLLLLYQIYQELVYDNKF